VDVASDYFTRLTQLINDANGQVFNGRNSDGFSVFILLLKIFVGIIGPIVEVLGNLLYGSKSLTTLM
jgi:hypothetical protein